MSIASQPSILPGAQILTIILFLVLILFVELHSLIIFYNHFRLTKKEYIFLKVELLNSLMTPMLNASKLKEVDMWLRQFMWIIY